MRRSGFLAAALVVSSALVARHDLTAAADAPTFTKDVAPILHAKCVTCHRPGEVAPMALLTYQDARPFARSIRDKVTARQMPPWFADPAVGEFVNDARLSDAEIATIAKWFEGGAPQGDPKAMPKAPQFTDGWQLGEPDLIVDLPEVQIPATGDDYFPTPTVTLDLKEDRWVRALEIRPGNRKVTHHSVIFATSQINIMSQSGIFDVLGVWAVGTPPTVYPDGMGRWIRKGQTLRTNLHYHPNGTPQVDRTRVGLYFGEGAMKKEVVSALAGNVTFTIPPNAPNHELKALYVVDQDIDVTSFFPHMHLRGKDMKMTATFPDGRQETLLNVPGYDFNWQLFYYPKKSVRLPRGTRVDIVAHYDNSPGNRHNPDPSKTVRFGEASATAEMMFGVFEFTAADGVSPKAGSDRGRMEALTATLPKETTFLIDIPFTTQSTAAVLSLPKTGEASFYFPMVGLVMPQNVNQLKWEENSFSFQTAILVPGPAAGFYTVTGTVAADGSVTGRLARRGNTQPPFYEFSGSRRGRP